MCVPKGLHVVLQKGMGGFIEGQCFRRWLVRVGRANLCLGKFVSKGTWTIYRLSV